jgi:hypothetical protein
LPLKKETVGCMILGLLLFTGITLVIHVRYVVLYITMTVPLGFPISAKQTIYDH